MRIEAWEVYANSQTAAASWHLRDWIANILLRQKYRGEEKKRRGISQPISISKLDNGLFKSRSRPERVSNLTHSLTLIISAHHDNHSVAIISVRPPPHLTISPKAVDIRLAATTKLILHNNHTRPSPPSLRSPNLVCPVPPSPPHHFPRGRTRGRVRNHLPDPIPPPPPLRPAPSLLPGRGSPPTRHPPHPAPLRPRRPGRRRGHRHLRPAPARHPRRDLRRRRRGHHRP